VNCPVLIFLKAPIKGQVKTRLAQNLGVDMALDLYRAFVCDVLETAGRVGEVILFYTPEEKAEETRDLVGAEYRLLAQQGTDLGEKMALAFETVFARGLDKAVLMGTDVPDVPESMIREACEALDSHAAVLGPVTDGGYFLIGLKQEAYTRDLFRDIPWSTERVLEKTLERMRENRIECHVLSFWHDVDTGSDFNALKERLKSGQTRAPQTQACITTHGTDHIDYHPGSE
jgi:uncharacterized protein